MTEDEKQKIKDYQKQYRENNPLTEDKKQKMKKCYINSKDLILEHAKNKYKSLTEDEKQKKKDYRKQYRQNNLLTEDKKQKMKEYQKEYKKI